MPRPKNKDMFEPQPYRVRNILTLEERVRAIRAYDMRPMYTKVARTFNCSWEQIKNIVANREAIMTFYEATKNSERHLDAGKDDLRQRKINFLGECMYEYIQRIQFHTKVDITEELIRMKAFEFIEIMEIEKFMPNRAWINHFKATYNFSLSNRQIKLTRTPPSSLDLKDIMTYCTKNRANIKKLFKKDEEEDADMYCDPLSKLKIENAKQRRNRKLQFMERALLEYIQRAQYHKKVDLTESLVRKLAIYLKDVLKIDNFQPNGAWFAEFRKRFSFYFNVDHTAFKRAPPLSLDLKDILSYCSRIEPKNQIHLSLTHTSNVETPKIRVRTPALVQAALQHMQNTQPEIKEEVIVLDTASKDADLQDIKPDIRELESSLVTENKRTNDEDLEIPALKIQKVESCMEETVSADNWLDEPADKGHLPHCITNPQDALRLLKPLEEYALLKENYRAIGLISQLEEIFKKIVK